MRDPGQIQRDRQVNRMQYGRIVYTPGPMLRSGDRYVNVGDTFQTLAVDLVYDTLGIPQSIRKDVERHTLREYDGEDVILPMNGWFGTGRGGEIFPLSPHIRPVWFGYHNVTKADAQHIPKDVPIGCRDEKTFDLIRGYTDRAFLSGCLTILFPTRERVPENGKVFIVDVADKIAASVPADLRKNAVLLSHEVLFHTDAEPSEEIRRIENISREYICRYRDEASLVITSRLHCAMACIALGVPVIVMRDSFDERYAFVEKFIPLYAAGEFDRINWNPSPVDTQYIKAETMRTACALLSGEDIPAENALHAFYMDRTRHAISKPFMVKAYDAVRDVSPALADFIREKILFRFTISASRGKDDG